MENYSETQKQMSDKTIWILIGLVFLSLVIVLVMVYNREKEKPDSPHALVAAGFTTMFTTKATEWKPGMGKKPLVYHPAASVQPVWKPLQRDTQRIVNQPMNTQKMSVRPVWKPLPVDTNAF